MTTLPTESVEAYRTSEGWLDRCDQYCDINHIAADRWLNALERSQLYARLGRQEQSWSELSRAKNARYANTARLEFYAGALQGFAMTGDYRWLLASTISRDGMGLEQPSAKPAST